MYIYIYQSGQLSVTQKRGIIKLTPKKDAEPFLFKIGDRYRY